MDAIEIAGGKSAFVCPADAPSGSEKPLTLAEVKALNPDMIILTNPAAAKVIDDPNWQALPAYKNGTLHIVSYSPLGWLHHFSPYTRFLGIPWLACELYPDKCTIDINKEAKRYHKLFLGMDLSDQQLDQILNRFSAATPRWRD